MVPHIQVGASEYVEWIHYDGLGTKKVLNGVSFQAVSEDWWRANLLKNEDVRTHQLTPLSLDLVELAEMHV